MKKVSAGMSQSLFEDASKHNPYGPDTETQFSIRKDDHGHIVVKHLDKIFKYVELGTGTMELENNDDSTPQFNKQLKDFLVSAYATSESLAEQAKFWSDSDFPGSDALADSYEMILAINANQGFDRSSLDTSIALIFGNQTTVGQVCAYARGLEDGTVDDMPGFCCLDAPYESIDWGEKVRKIANCYWKYRPPIDLNHLTHNLEVYL